MIDAVVCVFAGLPHRLVWVPRGDLGHRPDDPHRRALAARGHHRQPHRAVGGTGRLPP